MNIVAVDTVTRVWLCDSKHRHTSVAKARACNSRHNRAAKNRDRKAALSPPDGFLTAIQARNAMVKFGIGASSEDICNLCRDELIEFWCKNVKGRKWIDPKSLKRVIDKAVDDGIDDARELLGRKKRHDCPECGRGVVRHPNGKFSPHSNGSNRCSQS